MTVMILMLLVIYMLSSVGSTSFSKATSKVVSGASRAKYSLFLIVNGLTACFFFWIFGGFKLDVKLPTLIYSAIYDLIKGRTKCSKVITVKRFCEGANMTLAEFFDRDYFNEPEED